MLRQNKETCTFFVSGMHLRHAFSSTHARSHLHLHLPPPTSHTHTQTHTHTKKEREKDNQEYHSWFKSSHKHTQTHTEIQSHTHIHTKGLQRLTVQSVDVMITISISLSRQGQLHSQHASVFQDDILYLPLCAVI